MKKHLSAGRHELQKITLFSALLLSVGITAFGQTTISFNPPNPSVCFGGILNLSAQLNQGTTPTLSFPYTKISGTEIFVSTTGSDASGNGTASNPFLTIQAGINAATNGQIVTILSGTYSGMGNLNLSTLGKQITVQSDAGPLTTIIDCNLNGRGFKINQGESMTTVIKGLSIINGKNNVAPLLSGSAIFVEDNSGIKIVDCIFKNNQEGCIQLGDTEVSGPQSAIENCAFIQNIKACISASKKSYYTESCFFYGNDVQNNGLVENGHVANPAQYHQNCIIACNTGNVIGYLGHGKIIQNSLFIGNSSTNGTMYMGTNWSGTNTINHCTFYNNTCGYYNAGWSDHTGQVLSSIFYPGDARNHVSGYQASIPFSFSSGNNISGNGNIQGNPLFMDPNNFNFNLSPGSPCIGTGQSGSNMGADVSLIPSWEFNFLNYYSTQFTSEWENGITSDTISLNLTESQFIDVTFSNCSQTYTDSIWVEVYNTPNISAGNDTTACLGGLFSLTASGGDSYTWTPSIFNGVPFTVDSAATFIVQGVDSNGCSSSDTVYVSVIDPTITADQTAFCLGDSTALSINTNGNSCGNLTGSLQNGLKGWWPFCGNANDESGNGNNGTVNGATLAADRFGNSNQAYSLDGQNDDIRITLNSINNNFPSGSTITCNAWVKTSDLNGPLMAFRGGNTTFNYNIGTLTNIVTSPGKIGMLIRDDQTCCGSGNNIFGSSIADNNWHMVTLIRDGSNNGIIKLYVNTLLVATSAAGQNGSLTFNAAKMSFGSEQEWITTGFSTSTDQEYLNGNLDDIGIWNRALTQQEIESLYNQENLTNLWSDGTTNQSSIQVQPMQTTIYSVTVSDGVGSCTDSITIQVNNPQINAGNALSICEGDSTTLTATGASTYAWNNGVVNGQAFVPTVEGLYSVVGTDTLGCSNSDTLFLDLLQPTSSSISPVNCVTFTAPDGAIYTNSGQYVAVIPNNSGCDSTISINLTINSTSTGTDTKVACDSYTWIDGNTYTSNTNSATYVLQNANGCDSTVALNLTINKLNGLNAGNDINACEGDNITLSATGATSYNWTGVVSNGIPFVPSVGTTIYTVTGTDDNGCTATDALTVLVEYCLDIPGGISPNGDNSNDTWTINGLDQYPDAKVYVFDRWGQKVFSGDATNPTWNGTYEGKELPTADYYYIIELGNGEKFNGVVTLKK